MKKAEKNEKSELWLDPEKFPSVEDEKMVCLASIILPDDDLMAFRASSWWNQNSRKN